MSLAREEHVPKVIHYAVVLSAVAGDAKRLNIRDVVRSIFGERDDVVFGQDDVRLDIAASMTHVSMHRL